MLKLDITFQYPNQSQGKSGGQKNDNILKLELNDDSLWSTFAQIKVDPIKYAFSCSMEVSDLSENAIMLRNETQMKLSKQHEFVLLF